MGGEHRLPRNARLCEESDRRSSRIPASLRRVSLERLSLSPAISIAGVDVGEDFLDLALIRAGARTIDHRRVPLGTIQADAIESLLGFASGPRDLSIDLIDAEILGLSVAHARLQAALPVASNAAEGRFLVALDTRSRKKVHRKKAA